MKKRERRRYKQEIAFLHASFESIHKLVMCPYVCMEECMYACAENAYFVVGTVAPFLS